MGLIKTAAKVAVASSVHGRVQRRQHERWAASEQSQQPGAGYSHQPASPASHQPAAGDPDARIAQLKALAELKASGILTDAEFEAEKRKVLQS
ncbi:MAG: SHOCT domain-containing protein [Conexibacteraceae bacterium]|nr:SHOCT domain-containing protein [Conexibacteraceae bacterium]